MAPSNNTPAAASKDIFPFLSLPPELRNLVYQKFLSRDPEAKAPCYAQILRTCRQVKQEATAMLYAENTARMFISWNSVLISNFPLISTNCPLHRIEKLAIHMRVVFDFWDYDEKNPNQVRENASWLCRHLPKHHAIKELALRITWAAPSSFGSSYSDRVVEEMILSPFFSLRNIEAVSIDSSASDAFEQRLKDAMQSPHEQ